MLVAGYITPDHALEPFHALVSLTVDIKSIEKTLYVLKVIPINIISSIKKSIFIGETGRTIKNYASAAIVMVAEMIPFFCRAKQSGSSVLLLDSMAKSQFMHCRPYTRARIKVAYIAIATHFLQGQLYCANS